MSVNTQSKDPLFAGTTSAKRTIGKRIGSGGETTVYDCPEAPGIALAVLHQVDPDTEDRIRFVIAWTVAIGLLKFFAWPLELLTDKSGRVVGFTMRLVKGKLLSTYLSPVTRPPSVTLLWMLLVFKQISECIHAAHASGFRIGDLNCNNIMVKPDGQIVMLDVLSFYVTYQQRVFSTKAGVVEFLPPELLDAFDKGDLANQPRTTHGDSYSFGVLLFKGLFEFHPFANREMVDIETVVKSGEWPYHSNNCKYHPKTASPPLTSVPPVFVDLFTRCFVAGMKEPSLRPTMLEWHKGLTEWIETEELNNKRHRGRNKTFKAQTSSSMAGSVSSPNRLHKPSLATPLVLLLSVILGTCVLLFEAKTSDEITGDSKGKETPKLWMDLHRAGTTRKGHL